MAHDLSPADVILFKQHRFASFITDLGGATSHTAILARSLNIPSIVALHHARQLIRESELLIVDGPNGVVIVNPDANVLMEYELRQEQWQLEREKLKRLKTTRAATLDGTRIELQANIELPEDVAQAKDNAAAGIGLFRSEFLFLSRAELPGEDEQFEAYRRVAVEMDGLPVTVRTLDLGADKHPNGAQRFSPNPALGLRAIRLCLAEPQMFHRQLRAILRASHYGKIKILVPMLSTVHELNQTLHLIGEAKRSLDEDGIAYDARDPGRRHDRGARGSALARARSSSAWISSPSAPTTSSSTRSPSTAPTTRWRTCTTRCIRRCSCWWPTSSAAPRRPASRSRCAARWPAT